MLSQAFSETFEEINSEIDLGEITMNAKTYKLEFFLGSDLKVCITCEPSDVLTLVLPQFILLVLGLNEAHSNYSCALCHIHKDER